jgi:hypothetical protein
MIRLLELLFPELKEQSSIKKRSSGEVWRVDPNNTKTGEDSTQTKYGGKMGEWVRYFDSEEKARNFAMGRRASDKNTLGPGLRSTSKENPRGSQRPIPKKRPRKPKRIITTRTYD